MFEKPIEISDALHSLVPGAQWVIEENDTNKITWLDASYEQPSAAEINAEIERLISEKATVEAEKLATKNSALEKLARLGLTEDEARAIIGT